MCDACKYINVPLPVTAITAQALIDTLVDKVPDATKELHLLINSPGGSVPVAMGIAKILEGLSCKLITYNTARCDSAALVIYAAGIERICIPEGEFLAHTVNIELSGNYSLDALGLEYRKLRQEYKNVISYLARKTGISKHSWQNYMTEKGHVFSSKEALRRGLSTKVSELSLPRHSELLTVEVRTENRPSIKSLPK